MTINTTKKTLREVIDQSPLPLPIGYKNANGSIIRTAEIKDMTGRVDEAIADPKIRGNGGKIVTEAVFGVLAELGDEKKVRKDDVRKMFGADREFLLMASFHNSVAVDEFVKWTDTCRSCRKTFEAQLNYLDLPVYYLEGDTHIMELNLPRGITVDASGTRYSKMKVTFPNGEVQERVAAAVQANPGSALTTIIAMCVEEIEGLTNWNFETFKDMVKKDRNAVGEFINDMKVGIDMTTDLQCPNCGQEFKSGIPVSALLGE